MTFALLPVKDPRQAKQRLAGALTPAEREAFARLLFEHALSALLSSRGLDRVVVIASDAAILAHARRSGADVFEETGQRGHSHSADRAARRAMEMGARTVLLAPIDVPLVTPAEIEALIHGAGPGVAIVPSADGTGTNALVRTPPDAITSRFGPGSFAKHCAETREKGLELRVLRPLGLVFDVDTPSDVAEWLARDPDSRAAEWMRSRWTFASRA